MPTFDCLLEWLEHYKPLWDFLTAIGTVGLTGLAVVTIYQSTRKPRIHLALKISLINNNETILVTVTNDAEATPVLLRYVWRTQESYCFQRDFSLCTFQINGQKAGNTAPRLTNGDVLTTWVGVTEIATAADNCLQRTLSQDNLNRLVRDSLFVCVTTSGDSFTTLLTPDVQRALVSRIKLERGMP